MTLLVIWIQAIYPMKRLFVFMKLGEMLAISTFLLCVIFNILNVWGNRTLAECSSSSLEFQLVEAEAEDGRANAGEDYYKTQLNKQTKPQRQGSLVPLCSPIIGETENIHARAFSSHLSPI